MPHLPRIPYVSPKNHQTNFLNSLISKITNHTHILQQRQLTPLGKSLVINSLLTAKLWHAARLLPLTHHTQSIIKPLGQFFWSNRQPSISWKILCLPRESGGLGIISIQEQSDALLLRHLIPLYVPTHPFRSFAHDYLEFVLQHVCQLSSHIPILLAPTYYATFFRRYPLIYFMLKVASSFHFVKLPHPVHPSLFFQLPLAMFLQSHASFKSENPCNPYRSFHSSMAS